MGESSSVDEVLEFAIDREIEANQLYMDLAQQTGNAAMRKVFEDFAREELSHKAKLEAMKKGKAVTLAPVTPDLKIADYVVGVEPMPNMDYKDALILAMQKEKASFHLYTDRFEIEYDDVVLKEN
jgi:rubrerythrin